MPSSTQRETALKLVDAFNRMDLGTIAALRSPDCVRQILPKSLGFAPQNNETYNRSLQKLLPIFRNFELTMHDLVEDVEARKISLALRARADTDAGEYVNEYVWILDFNEDGTQIEFVKEYVDTVVNRDFWPKLAAAMKRNQSRTAATDAT